MALERLLRDMRMERAVPHNKRRDMLNVLGYDWHPTLRDGRVNNPIMIDGGKPRLFIREGNLALQITNAADVVKAYVQAQPLSGGAVDSVVKGERI